MRRQQSRSPIAGPAGTQNIAEDRSEMSQEESEKRPARPVPLGHNYETPVVEEVPRETPHPAQKHIDSADGDVPAGSRNNTTDPDAP
jgi:hypothetical protein